MAMTPVQPVPMAAQAQQPLQQIPLIQPQIAPSTPSRPPTSVFDMSQTATNTWPASSPTPQYPLPPVVQSLASNVAKPQPKDAGPKPSTATTPLKPSVLGTSSTSGLNLSVTPSTPPTASKPFAALALQQGAGSNQAQNSPFSTYASSPFGNLNPGATPSPAPKPSKPDSATSSFFSSLTAATTPTTGFSFGSPAQAIAPKKDSAPLTGSFFAGAAAEAAQRATEDHDDGAHDESVEHDHDPHFEPIIPLPELVKVTTGEEDEEELFAFKGKMYR